MTRLSEAFDGSRRSAAFIPYVCAGDPDRDFTMKLMRALGDAGSDIIELGMPFSDPVADGPVIQEAMNRSLTGGFRPAHLFDLISGARRGGLSKPIVVMTYFNPVLRMGVEKFCERLEASGADGVLPVDLPIEESGELEDSAARHNLDVIRLIAPSTDDGRMDRILSKAQGFVYVVSVAGTTGMRDKLPGSTGDLLQRVVAKSKLPVVLGFGVSSPEHVRDAVSFGASGVVEGSKLVSLYAGTMSQRADAIERIRTHVRAMKAACSKSD